MLKFSVLRQYLIPQHFYTRLMGILATCRIPWLKNYLIKIFIDRYQVDMKLAVVEDYKAYPTFNEFFIRHLKPALRPIVSGPGELACPADGTMSQLGKINHDQLFQAKGFYYDLTALLGGPSKWQEAFLGGDFATIYLAPRDYHRIHIPFSGCLKQTVYIPGSLFSVNQDTTEAVPSLFSRNERLVCFFDTEIGLMAVILVGAMIVGNIVTAWDDRPKSSSIQSKNYPDLPFSRGAEIGYFNVGSTVILLFGKDKVAFDSHLQSGDTVRMGQLLGRVK